MIGIHRFRSWGVVAVLAACLAWTAPPVRPVQAQVERTEIRIENARVQRSGREPAETTIVVDGRAYLPEGAVVRVSLQFGEERAASGTGGSVLEVQAPLESGTRAFHAEFSLGRARLMPGVYRLEADLRMDEQRVAVHEKLAGREIVPGSYELRVGTPEEAQAELDRLKAKYLDILENLRQVYVQLAMWGSFTNAKAVRLRIKHLGDLPSDEADAVWREWRRFTDTVWSEGFPTVRYDFVELTRYVKLSYFPQTDQAIQDVLAALDRWHAAYTQAICDNIGIKPPKDVLERGGGTVEDLESKLKVLAANAYTWLGVQPFPWRVIDRGSPEEPSDIQGDLFRSSVSKFEIRKPEDWIFDFGRVNPDVRIRLMPNVADDQRLVTSGVEIRDYPTAESFKELSHLVEAMTRNAMPGFQEIVTEDLEVPDSTMPDGIRPGLGMVYTVQQEGATYKVFQYALFCRWHKRAYVYLGLSPEAHYDTFEPALMRTSDTFKVLDDPAHLERGPSWVPEENRDGGGD